MNKKTEQNLPTVSQDAQPHIQDFCDMQLFERMLEDWSISTGLAAVAIGSDGCYVSKYHNFTDFCQKLTRKTPEGLRRCTKCDQEGRGTYLCHAGLVDFASAITLEDGTVLGNMLGGQVLPQQPDEAKYRATAQELGIDPETYIKALRKVNVRTPKEIKAAARLLSDMVNMFVRTSWNSRQDAKTLLERTHIISSLSKIYFCNYYIDLRSDSYLEIDATFNIHQLAGKSGKMSATFVKACHKFVQDAYQKDFLAFTDRKTLNQRLGTKTSIVFEFINHLHKWCRSMFIAVSRDNAGKVTHVLFAIQDIQEEKEKELRIQEALQKSADAANRASKVKSDFLARMSHDMRTPLNGIIGMTHLSLGEADMQRIKHYLSEIDVSSNFLLGLINDVLDMSKIESKELQLHPVPFKREEFLSYIDAVIKPICEEKSQRLIVDVDLPPDYVLIVDKQRLCQIAFNLLSNASKYSPEGGTINFLMQGKLLQGQNKIALHTIIKDNGIGISKEFQKIMFDPFTQENRVDNYEKRGSGLGLAITKKLMDLLDGTIRVKSEMGKGTTFILDFTLAFTSLAKLQKKQQSLVETAYQDELFLDKHILLCEDHPLNQEIVQLLLTKKGMIVEIAADGKMGLDKFTHSSINYYDAILMDVRMPVLDGYETTKAIRTSARKDAGTVPIIALSANVFTDDVDKGLKVGMNDYLSKPVEPQKLYRTLGKYFNESK